MGGDNLMAILYKANETDFTHFGLGPLSDATSIIVTEERNGMFELEMQYPVSGRQFKELKNGRLIKADAGYILKDQRFKIIRITKPLKGMVTVYAEHISYLAKDLALKPVVNFTGNAHQALSTWKANIIDDNPFVVSSNITTTASGRWSIDLVENPRRALGGVSGSLLDLYGGEYLFNNYQVALLSQRGVNSSALIAYGRNLTDLTQEEEIANTYTSIYPYAVYTDDSNKQILVTLPEYYIDSEHVGNYPERKILAVDFSANEIKTESALRTAANQYITSNNVGVPKVNLKIKYLDLTKTLEYRDTLNLEAVNLCDNVNIYFEKFDINTKAKVIKVIWDVLQSQYQSIEIGEARSSLSEAINATVDGRVADVEKKVNIIQVQADGMKLIYRQVDRPPNGTNVGDLWYQPNGIYEIMYQWDGSDWKEVLNTSDLDKVSREVNEAIAEIADVKTDIDDRLLLVNQEIANNFTSLSDSLSTVSDISNQAKTDAQTALNSAQSAINQLDGLGGQLTTVQNDIDDINGVLLQKVSTADFNSLTGRVNVAEGQIQTQAGQIALRVTEVQAKSIADSAVGALEIGVANLLKNSKSNWTHRSSGGVWWHYFIGQSNISLSDLGVSKGDTVTFSAELRPTDSPANVRATVHNEDGYTGFLGDRIAVGSEGVSQITFVIPSNATGISFGFDFLGAGIQSTEIYYRREKFEKGNKATDWSPAPEDTIQLISNLSAELTIEKDNITALLTRTTNNETVINQVKSTADGTVQTVANHAGRLTTVETNVSGLQISVADKVSNAQFTVVSNSLTSVISSLETMTSPGDNLIINGSFESENVGWTLNNATLSTDSHSGNKSLKPGLVTGLKATLRTPVVVIPGNTYEISFWCKTSSDANGTSNNQKIRLGRMDGSLITDLGWTGSNTEWTKVTKKWVVPSGVYATQITIISNHTIGWVLWDDISIIDVTAQENAQSQITQLSTDINLRVTKGEVMSQINIEAGRTLISSNKLYLDANTVTFSGSAFIPSAAISSLSADKITTGSLNAANVNIINLNVSSIVGLNSAFIQSNWNSATGGNVQATGDGLTARNASSTFYTRLTSGLIYFGDDLNTTVGSMGSMVREGSNTIRGVGIYVENNKEFGVAKRWSASGAYEYIMRSAINSKGLDIFAPLSVRATMNMHGNQIHNAERIYFGDTTEGIMRYPSDGTLIMYGSEGVRLGNGNATNYTTRVHVGSTTTTIHNNLTVNSDATFNAALNMGTNQITNVSSIIMQGGTTALTRSSTNIAVVTGSAGVYLSYGTAASWSQRLFVGDTVVRVFRNLDMNGYTITGQSDRRLKTDITPTSTVALDGYRQLNMVDFSWIDPNKPSGRHLGVIAQDTPFWSVYDAERDIWMIDSSRQMMYNSLGIKELTAIADKHTSDILRIDTFVGQYEQEINNLKQEIASLKQEVEYLKSA